MARLDEYRLLERRSREFYETALAQIGKGYYALACFSLEQSLQLFLKAQLLASGAEYPRTHSVRLLLDMLSEVLGEPRIKSLLKEFSLELAALEDVYITARYVAREFRREEAERLKAVVDKIREVVLEAAGRRGQEKS